jgi:hypothetical protein
MDIKKRRLKSLGHVIRMDQVGVAMRCFERKKERKEVEEK